MHSFPATLSVLTLLAGAAFGQSQELYHIDRPAGANLAWRGAMVALDDLDGDGVGELLISGTRHGGGQVGTVHSGATGDFLFHLSVPFARLFYGDGFTPLADRNGDGIADIVMIGSRSGDSQSYEGELRIHSGADGATLFAFRPPVGLNFVAHGESTVKNLGDMDGDGFEDILCRVNGVQTGGPTYSLMSSADGQPIYTIANVSDRASIEGVVLVADQDGDGKRDLALLYRATSWAEAFLVVTSGATGQKIREFSVPELSVVTGNREPFVGARKSPASPLEHVAFGGVFQGAMARISVVDGSLVWASTCNLSTESCFGSRLLDVADLNNDGHNDMIALEAGFVGGNGLGLQVIDGRTGAVLSQETLPNLVRGYSNGDRLISMPGVDPQGFPVFAIAEDLNNRISVRRLIPEIGRQTCEAKPNSTGQAAVLRIKGSADSRVGYFELSLEQAPPGISALIAFGDGFNRVMFGEGVLCISGRTGRLPLTQVDASGRLTMTMDLTGHGLAHGSWTFQALFWDGWVQNSSASTTVKLH